MCCPDPQPRCLDTSLIKSKLCLLQQEWNSSFVNILGGLSSSFLRFWVFSMGLRNLSWCCSTGTALGREDSQSDGGGGSGVIFTCSEVRRWIIGTQSSTSWAWELPKDATYSGKLCPFSKSRRVWVKGWHFIAAVILPEEKKRKKKVKAICIALAQ